MQLEEIVKSIAGIVRDSAAKYAREETAKALLEVEPRLKALEEPDTAIEQKIADELAKLPKPKDGEPGKDGETPEAPSAEDVAKAMEGHFAKWALEFERKADGVLEKAVDKLRQPADGKDGRDALELDDIEMELADDGRTVIISLKRGEDMTQKAIKLATILDRGVYRPDDVYEKGDAVTFGGSLWIAQKDAPEGKPGIDDAWRLSVKRGRDAKQQVKI